MIELHQGCRDEIGKHREIQKSYGQRDSKMYDRLSLTYVGDDFGELQ